MHRWREALTEPVALKGSTPVSRQAGSSDVYLSYDRLNLSRDRCFIAKPI